MPLVLLHPAVRGKPAEATRERLLPAPTGPRGYLAKHRAHALHSCALLRAQAARTKPLGHRGCLWHGARRPQTESNQRSQEPVFLPFPGACRYEHVARRIGHVGPGRPSASNTRQGAEGGEGERAGEGEGHGRRGRRGGQGSGINSCASCLKHDPRSTRRQIMVVGAVGFRPSLDPPDR